MARNFHFVFIGILLVSLVAPVSTRGDGPPADPAERKAAEPKKDGDSKEKEKKKEDETPKSAWAAMDPDAAQRFAVTLSSAVGALIAVQTVPASFRTSFQAIREMRNFRTHHADYLRLGDELQKFLEKKEGLLKELGVAFERYSPALKELDEHIRGVVGEEKTDVPGRTDQVRKDLEELMELPGAGRWRAKFAEALEAWKTHQGSYPIEHWIQTHLNSQFLKEGPGRAWLLRYVQHTKELAAAYWLETGSTLLLDQWAENNKSREAVFTPVELKWQRHFTQLRRDETKAANVFLRDFASFTRNLNRDLADPGLKFSILLTWAQREPGEFHTSEGGSPVPLLAAQVLDFSKGRCDAGMKALSEAHKRARDAGAYYMLPWQGLRAVAPGLSGGATLATGYVAIRGVGRLWSDLFSPPKKKDEKP